MRRRLMRLFNPSAVRLVGTVLALALMVYLLRRQGWREVGQALGEIEAWRFLLAFGLVLLSRFFVIWRWHVLLRSSGIQVSAGQSARLTLAGLFASNFLPTTVGGDAVRLAGTLQLGFDGAVSAASLVVDRLVGMAGMALILPVGVQRFWQAGALAALTWLPAAPRLAASIPLAWGKWTKTVWQKASGLWKRGLHAMSLWAGRPRALAGALFFTFLHMSCFFGSMYVLLAGMGESMSLGLVGGLWSLVYFITLVPVSINGLGLQEVSVAFIFPELGGISPHSGLTLALLFRTLTLFASLPGAAFLSGVLPAAKRRQGPLGGPLAE